MAGPRVEAIPGQVALTSPESPASADTPPQSKRRFGRVLPWSLFVLALLAAVLFAGLWQGARAREHRRAEVASQATRFLEALTNFSADTIDRDVEEIRAFALGNFAEEVRTFFGPQAVAALKEADAKSVGRVRSVFVQSLSGDSATVFGVINETIANSSTPAPQTEVVRVDLEMVKTDSGWKVDRVDILQSPSGVGVPGG